MPRFSIDMQQHIVFFDGLDEYLQINFPKTLKNSILEAKTTYGNRIKTMQIDSTKETPTIPGTELNIVTERVKDAPLLIAQMVKMGLPEILDRHLPKSYNQRLS